MLEHVVQIPLLVAGTYDTYDSVSHETNKNYDARSHDRNLASTNNSSDGGFVLAFSLWFDGRRSDERTNKLTIIGKNK